MTEATRVALHDFYESFFPYPSQFEKVFERRLTPGPSSVRYLWVVAVFFLIGFLGLFFCHLCRVCLQTIHTFRLIRFTSLDCTASNGPCAVVHGILRLC